MKKQKLYRTVLLALFAGIIIAVSFPPLDFIGYLKISAVDITLIPVFVASGAILLGPAAGAVLGGVFGATSLIQAATGLSPFGSLIFQEKWLATVIICIIPRILMGWLCGLIFRALSKIDKTKFFSYSVASISCAILNTVFFVALFLILFGNSTSIDVLGQSMGVFANQNLVTFVATFVGINGIFEAIACLILGTAISKALSRYMSHLAIKE